MIYSEKLLRTRKRFFFLTVRSLKNAKTLAEMFSDAKKFFTEIVKIQFFSCNFFLAARTFILPEEGKKEQCDKNKIVSPLKLFSASKIISVGEITFFTSSIL